MKIYFKALLIILALSFTVYLVRLTTLRQIDDVSPEIPCKESELSRAQIIFVIPIYENKSIADNKNWCDYILSLNKTIGMHGVYHSYNEFAYPKDQKYLDEGINAFEKCFGFKPKFFKAPQLNISSENKILIRNNMILVDYPDQIFHKVYHCSDSGYFSNNFMDWI